ncbi:hypothetical protein [Bifidobacterium saguinibicoloris]|uniref:hypothetical protein n=1 Tax=Bifidobacterium saguinibicoloris TaxID=2834433 RepID=UPI001C57EA86|nr:hypothetical protein [Bifidobacterium saguinibicoloris]MBW3081218.1 hypothetical protein [Bifidobacterium saguinibicoloris]
MPRSLGVSSTIVILHNHLNTIYRRVMKQHKAVNSCLEQAMREQRCAFGDEDALRRALKRRADRGELISPYQNLYVPPEYWRTMNTCQRSLHVARGLARLHPRWIFAAMTAADAHGFDHSWNIHDRCVYLANNEGRLITSKAELSRRMPVNGYRVSPRLDGRGHDETKEAPYQVRRLYVPSIESERVNGIRVTNATRTLIDCGLSLPFRFALPLFDSAARKGLDMDTVRKACKGMHEDGTPIQTLLRHATAESENGGESMVRAIIIDNGFAVPQLQVEFRDPAYPVRRFRADFVWRLYDGRIIVLEYDGMAKYEDPSMTHGRTARQLFNERDERDRTLRAAGVTTILHCTYEDAFISNRLFMMLRDSGVPQLTADDPYRR